MIDDNGYRLNVGIVICNKDAQVFWARCYKKYIWQFPQGGINNGETLEQAMYRELFEEVGLNKRDVLILSKTCNWLYYNLPTSFIRYENKPICIGQKQKWFLLKLICDEKYINMKKTCKPEFDNWRWVSFWYPIRKVISFKREVYRNFMKTFSNVLM